MREIKHGDYGITMGGKAPRFFRMRDGTVAAFDASDTCCIEDANEYHKEFGYIIHGNIFEDLRRAR